MSTELENGCDTTNDINFRSVLDEQFDNFEMAALTRNVERREFFSVL